MASTSKKLTQREIEDLARRYDEGETDLEDNGVICSEDEESEDELVQDSCVEDDMSAEELSEGDVEQDTNNKENTNVLSSAPQSKGKIIYGKNRYKWYDTPFTSRTTRTQQKNIVIHLPGPKGLARSAETEFETWKLFFDEEIMTEIVDHTNEEIERQSAKYKNSRFVHATDVEEMYAFIGLLYFTGTWGLNHVNTEEIWSKQFGIPVFRATMSEKRFLFLVNCIRFDDKDTRAQRKKTDKFAPIRNIFSKFVQNSDKYYTNSEYVTVDEQLLGFRGRCPFKIYIANKPDKYGIKIVMLCDAKTWYMKAAIPYVGKETRTSTDPIPTQYVMNLSKSLYGTNRNVTVDNWFCSLDLAEKLFEKNLTLVGTLRKNKADIPPGFLQKKKQVPCSDFVYDKNKVLVSFSPNKKKLYFYCQLFILEE